MAKDQQASIEERLARLEQAEAQLKEREAKLSEREASLEAQKDSGATRPVRPSEAVCVGDGYEFTVSPKKDGSALPTKKVRACDESEALRWYVATTASPENPAKQVDPVKHELVAKCTDPKRLDRQRNALLLASLRAKAERGGDLTNEEQEMLHQADLARLGL